MSKQFIAIVIIVVAILFGLFTFAKKDKDSNGSTASGNPSNHVVGKGTSGVTLTEYGDFQCPACKSYYPIVEQVKEDFGDRIKFQFKNFPLNQIHPHAFQAARSAEAAGKQGKFFEMYSLLYENQDSWSSLSNVTSVFESYAQQIGINLEQYRTDVQSSEVAATIEADIKEAQALGASSTPTFAINGKKIEENPKSIDEFRKLIDEEIERVRAEN